MLVERNRIDSTASLSTMSSSTKSSHRILKLLCALLFSATCAPAFVVSPPTAATRKFCACSTTRRFMSDEDSDTVCKGTVKWFDTIKGYGFIQPDDGSSDVFVHQTSIQTEGFRSLADGENVEYRVELDPSGRRKAVQVTGPDGEDVQGAPFRPRTDYDAY